jgi:cytochrome c-type biogenesis protein CcmH/NrfG
MTRRRARFLHGVRFRLVALVAVPLVPLVGIVAWQASQVRQRAHDDSMSDTLRVARLAAENLTSRITETKAVISSWAPRWRKRRSAAGRKVSKTSTDVRQSAALP